MEIDYIGDNIPWQDSNSHVIKYYVMYLQKAW